MTMQRAGAAVTDRRPPLAASFALAVALTLAALGAPAAEDAGTLPPVLTAEEAATLLRVDAETLELMVVAGTVPARRLTLDDGSEVTRFGRDALLEWLRTPLGAAGDAPPVGERASTASDATLGEEDGRASSTEVFLREQSVLSAAGERSVDIGLFYARQDGAVLLGGDAPGLATVTSRSALLQGVLRHGIADGTELFVRAGAERLDARLGLSDGYVALDGADTRTGLAAGIRHVLLEQDVGRPELIVGAEGRLPTGTSSVGLGGSLSVVKSLDPAVVFGSIAYGYVDGEDFDEPALLEPEHTLRADVGYALAMNERFSLNFAIEAGYRSRTEFGDTILLDDDYAGLQFGMTVRLSPSFYLQPVAGFSLSGGGNAYTIGIGVPFGFGSGR